MSEKHQLMETWFQRVWNERERDAIFELFQPQTEAHGLGQRARLGPEDFAGFHDRLCALVDDIRITIDRSLEEGDWIACSCTFEGRSMRDGRPVSMTGCTFVRVASGRIVEAYNSWDFLGLYEGLGLVPGDTFARGLAGEQLRWPE